MKRNLALILAAGRGKRAGNGLPKTYRQFAGEPILRRAVLAFLHHDQIDKVQVVAHEEDDELYHQALGDLDLPSPIWGGETRAQSVSNGLHAFDDYQNVLIHDGARPFVSERIIRDVIDALDAHDGAIPALPVVDALWHTDQNALQSPVSRENLVAAQTPQGFKLAKYKPLLEGGDALDDAQTARNAGLDVVWIAGDKQNRKLTYPEDFDQ